MWCVGAVCVVVLGLMVGSEVEGLSVPGGRAFEGVLDVKTDVDRVPFAPARSSSNGLVMFNKTGTFQHVSEMVGWLVQ